MKKTRSSKSPELSDELRPEYSFDYSKAKPNPFAAELQGRTVAVVLDPDVAEVFPSTEAVNSALRVLASVARRAQVSHPRRRQRTPGGVRSRKAG
jgi:hypothetical protein